MGLSCFIFSVKSEIDTFMFLDGGFYGFWMGHIMVYFPEMSGIDTLKNGSFS